MSLNVHSHSGTHRCVIELPCVQTGSCGTPGCNSLVAFRNLQTCQLHVACMRRKSYFQCVFAEPNSNFNAISLMLAVRHVRCFDTFARFLTTSTLGACNSCGNVAVYNHNHNHNHKCCTALSTAVRSIVHYGI